MESHFRRVHFMVRTIVYGSVNAYNRESCQNTGFGSFLNTFPDCRDIFFRNCTAHNLGIKFEQFVAIGIHGLKSDFTVSVLSASTGLFCILVFLLDGLGKGLFVCNLRCAYVCLHLEFTKETVNNDLQMEFTHTCNDGLSCLCVGVCTERRIFLCKFCKSLAHLALSCFCLGFDCQLNNRFRELHGLQNYRMLFITDGISCCGKLKSYCCRNITGVNFV